MNRRVILHTVGRILQVEAVLLLLPLLVAVLYGEYSQALCFALTAAVAVGAGLLLGLCFRPERSEFFAREGFVIVALTWVAVSLVGALPFVFTGEIPNYIDAFFETVSGFTTTGSSILTDVTRLSHGVAFWRSFTHWIGGMGVLVMIMAILPTDNDRSIHILRAEMPGPIVGKLVPRTRDTAKILYLIYFVMTAAEVIFLVCGDMDLFQSVIHAMGTAGTGGFGVTRGSVGDFSPYSQWVIAVFMLLFGVNFNLYYLVLARRFKAAVRSRELWAYGGIVVVAIGAITLNLLSVYESFGEAIRQASFQVSSVMTTTGYVTANYDQWPMLSRGILFLLMFIGGCAGSTAGGLKVSRVLLLIKTIKRELHRLIHPRSVGIVELEGKRVDETTVRGTAVYGVLYFFLLGAIFLLICWEPFSIEDNLSAAVTCMNNVGPGIGICGPAGNFAAYSAFSKIVLSVAMLLGRLEIYPILFAFAPVTWTKK